ncbi:MAG: ferritin-like domain-containing protein, partial [Chitinophagales bacterium]
CYVGDAHNTKQKNTFEEYHRGHGRQHGFSQAIFSPETALKAIEAIIEQGEGSDSKHVPADFTPHEMKEEQEYALSWYKGNLSHYQKFRILLHAYHTLPETYQSIHSDRNNAAQKNMEKLFIDFLMDLQKHFNTDGESMPVSFWQKMYGLRDAITEVWESGLCPDFNFSIGDRAEGMI